MKTPYWDEENRCAVFNSHNYNHFYGTIITTDWVMRHIRDQQTRRAPDFLVDWTLNTRGRINVKPTNEAAQLWLLGYLSEDHRDD